MIRLELPWLPPSSNAAYFNLPKGGRSLTTAGRKFKHETTSFFVTKFPKEMTYFKPNSPFALAFCFSFPQIENAGFVTGKAKSRYKVFDGGNRTKLLEDCLKDAGGIDDSQTLTSVWSKEAASAERTRIWVWNLETEPCPIHELIRNLP